MLKENFIWVELMCYVIFSIDTLKYKKDIHDIIFLFKLIIGSIDYPFLQECL